MADRRSPAVPWPVVCAGVALLMVGVVRTAWLSDDAYITLRTIDNFVNGFGLRWNVGERVQAFTHPGWLLLVTPFYAVTHEAYYTVIVLQIALSIATATLVLRGLTRSSGAAWVALAAMTGSKAFIEYSTSGLENGLTHLVLAAFFLQWLRSQEQREDLLLVGILTSCLMLCRLDLVLLVAPLLARSLIPVTRRRVVTFVAGLGVFAAWEVFGLLYYGQLVPNTALAKLPSGVQVTALATQGWLYLVATAEFDPVTPIVLVVGVILLLWRGGSAGRLCGTGILLHLFSVIAVGGDFMTGRFLTPIFLMAVIGVMSTVKWQPSLARQLALAGALGLIGVLNPAGPFRTGIDFSPDGLRPEQLNRHGVTDERRFYYADLGLLRVARALGSPDGHPNARFGRLLSLERQTRVASSVGLVGYYAGPTIHLIDRNALTDPLLSRLPPEPGWRIGHFVRSVPEGYVESCQHGDNRIVDAQVRALYEDVLTVTRGPIFSVSRLRAIWRLGRRSS